MILTTCFLTPIGAENSIAELADGKERSRDKVFSVRYRRYLDIRTSSCDALLTGESTELAARVNFKRGGSSGTCAHAGALPGNGSRP